jgi:hypothetical protein
MRLMIRGYSRTRPIKKAGKHTGNNSQCFPPDGCRDLNEPSYCIAGSKKLELWVVFE